MRETIMAQRQARAGAIEKVDPVWTRIRGEAEEIARREPELATFIYSTVLHHASLEAAAVHRVAARPHRPRETAVATNRGPTDALASRPRNHAAFPTAAVASG